MILDSTFLVDLERETSRSKPGGAVRFLEEQADTPLCLTFTIAGELAAGDSLGQDRARWETFLAPFRFLDYRADVGWRFGLVYRDLRMRGTLIGANDLWIAATALAYDLPLVTRNREEFTRVSGLEVLGY